MAESELLLQLLLLGHLVLNPLTARCDQLWYNASTFLRMYVYSFTLYGLNCV